MSRADLQNSQFITYQDQQNSLFEAYKDLYSDITKNDDDFFITTVYFTTVSATNPSPGEYLFPLPSDFYKIRTVEYQSGAYWVPMERFSLAARGSPSSRPRYRFQGNNLWVIGWIYPGFTGSYQLRVHYYPLPEQPTFPDQPINFGSGVPASSQSAVSSPFFSNIVHYNGNAMVPDRNFFYVLNGTSIVNESIDSGTFATLYIGTDIKNVQFYKGNLFFLDGTALYSAPFAVGDTTISPVAVTITGSPAIQNFNIFSNVVYYSDGSQTYSVSTSGGSPTSLGIGASTTYCSVDNNLYYAYVNSSGHLIINSFDLGAGYQKCFTDGNLAIFTLDISGNVSISYIDLTTPSAPALTKTQTIQSDVLYLGNAFYQSNSLVGGIISPFSTMLSIIGNETTRYQAVSGVFNTDFAYPLNSDETGEIMAIQCAIDFRSKQSQPFDDLKDRKAELLLRLTETMKRDDYKMERVSNVYGNRPGAFGLGNW